MTAEPPRRRRHPPPPARGAGPRLRATWARHRGSRSLRSPCRSRGGSRFQSLVRTSAAAAQSPCAIWKEVDRAQDARKNVSRLGHELVRMPELLNELQLALQLRRRRKLHDIDQHGEDVVRGRAHVGGLRLVQELLDRPIHVNDALNLVSRAVLSLDGAQQLHRSLEEGEVLQARNQLRVLLLLHRRGVEELVVELVDDKLLDALLRLRELLVAFPPEHVVIAHVARHLSNEAVDRRRHRGHADVQLLRHILQLLAHAHEIVDVELAHEETRRSGSAAGRTPPPARHRAAVTRQAGQSARRSPDRPPAAPPARTRPWWPGARAQLPCPKDASLRAEARRPGRRRR
eukprot:scaffold952_cov249-Pinguiococcus_pyrenoidosus.AAC.21